LNNLGKINVINLGIGIALTKLKLKLKKYYLLRIGRASEDNNLIIIIVKWNIY